MTAKEHIPLDEWRAEITPRLDLIHWEAMRARHHAAQVISKVLVLPCKPEWRTLALDEIDKAIKVMKASLETLENAKAMYDQKKAVT